MPGFLRLELVRGGTIEAKFLVSAGTADDTGKDVSRHTDSVEFGEDLAHNDKEPGSDLCGAVACSTNPQKAGENPDHCSAQGAFVSVAGRGGVSDDVPNPGGLKWDVVGIEGCK